MNGKPFEETEQHEEIQESPTSKQSQKMTKLDSIFDLTIRWVTHTSQTEEINREKREHYVGNNTKIQRTISKSKLRCGTFLVFSMVREESFRISHQTS